jgi:hypothetical protein
VLHDLSKVTKTPAKLLRLIAHRSTVIKKDSVKINAFSKSYAAAFLLLAGLTASLSQRPLENGARGLLLRAVDRRSAWGVWLGEISHDDL